MNYFQEQILQQKMVMTQEMMQSLEILQVSAVELKSIIEREHEENPLLEIVDNHETKDETKEVKENKDDYFEEEYFDESYSNADNSGNDDEKSGDFYGNIASHEPDIIKKFYNDFKLLIIK